MLLYKRFLCLLTLSCQLVLTGCGFQPLYMKTTTNVTEELQKVKVAVIPNRNGQILRNHLIDRLSTRNPSVVPAYQLKVSLAEKSDNLAFRRDHTPRHTRIRITATYRLIDLDSGKVIVTGNTSQIASYSLGATAEFGSFSSEVASHTIRERALRIIAEDVRVKLASYFNKQAEEKVPDHES